MIAASHLEGTTAAGTIRLAESAINEWLGRTRPGASAPSIDFRPDNQALIRYGVFQARVTLPPALDVGPQPRLTVTLASTMVAWGLKAMLTQSFISVDGRRVTIDLAAVPALQPYREWFPCFTAVHLSTTDSTVAVVFTFQVPE